MSFLSRLFGTAPDPKDALRPLYLGVVTQARAPQWYRNCGGADTIDGRFDMITNILAMVMLRMERDPALLPASARLTELFVDDMDGQLREAGFGDPTLGKKMGKMMEAMGGRLGAYRTAMATGRESMVSAVARNITLAENAPPDAMADALMAYAEFLDGVSDEKLMAGEISE